MGSITDLAEKVRSIFKDAMPDAEVRTTGRKGVTVFVISATFERMDDMERQDLLWDLLEKHLNRDEQRAVSIVVALTPKERAFHLAAEPS
jgi:acid stress-induced BolA-like protein IbaG/YrbA